MGEAKRREELGLPPREKKKENKTSKNQLNEILNKYPYLPINDGALTVQSDFLEL